MRVRSWPAATRRLAARVVVRTRCGVQAVRRVLRWSSPRRDRGCDRLLIATGAERREWPGAGRGSSDTPCHSGAALYLQLADPPVAAWRRGGGARGSPGAGDGTAGTRAVAWSRIGDERAGHPQAFRLGRAAAARSRYRFDLTVNWWAPAESIRRWRNSFACAWTTPGDR